MAGPAQVVWSLGTLTPTRGFLRKLVIHTQLLQVFRGTWHNITVAVKVSRLAPDGRSACHETVAEQTAWLAAHPILTHAASAWQLCLQIVETPVTPDKTEDVRTLVEFTLGQDLAHPNVVQTLDRTNCLIEVGPGCESRRMAQLPCRAACH